MAKYDHGGGCPCGLYATCIDGCQHYPPGTRADGTAAKPATPTARPCPFCSSIMPFDSIGHATDNADKWGAIECNACGARGPDVRTAYTQWPAWRDAALEKWNKRS